MLFCLVAYALSFGLSLLSVCLVPGDGRSEHMPAVSTPGVQLQSAIVPLRLRLLPQVFLLLLSTRRLLPTGQNLGPRMLQR